MPALDAFRNKLPSRVVLSYAFDYFIIIFFIIAFSALDSAEPHHQRFSLNNESLQYPYADPERISAAEAGVIACLFPLICVIFWTMIIDGLYSHHKPAQTRRRLLGGGGKWTMADRLWEMNCAILGLGLSAAGSIVITGALKNTTGKPRPDLIARCMPKPGSQNQKPWGLVTSDICTQPDNHILKDGFKSWPSGHASISFAGLGFLSFFLAGKLHVLDTRGEAWKTILVVIPLLAASLVAVSRIMDARHHPFDVITGGLMGFLVAWASYRQYYPALTDTRKKGRAYPMRSWGTDEADRKLGYDAAGQFNSGLVADEEEGQKLGVFNPQPSPMPLSGAGLSGAGGTGMGFMMERTTSSFSNESAAIQARKREAQRSAGRKNGFYDRDDEFVHSSEEGIELRNAPQPLRTSSYPPPTGISDESGDTRWGISQATAAITGAGAGQVGGFEPVRRSDTDFNNFDIKTTPMGTRELNRGGSGGSTSPLKE
ncbi:PAP2-domain-containing protein [Morchella conica CCBAS932]|uniref:PAP2-domain-containing protein n=1 Tax=Morchella conica CCBAS932 TaxID=1392247 RepID=A0A3N4KKG9_9PEZI|nr:PAP2-domain-containing protein [Morchella conica CCBAS932]